MGCNLSATRIGLAGDSTLLHPDIASVADDLVAGALASRDMTIAQLIQATQSKLAAKGMLRSGAAIHELSAVANEELRTVAATSWTALMNTLGSMPPALTPALKGDVQSVFVGMFSARYDALQAAILPAFRTSGDDVAKLGVEMVRKTYDALLKRYLAEITLWAAAYERPNVDSATPAATYVFHGSVGSVQTGANATAKVVQNLGSADTGPLLENLRELTEQIGRLSNLDPLSQRQVAELNGEIERELKSAEPNPLKLRGLFNGLGTFIQTLAATPTAYAVIQTSATALGLM